MSSAVEELRGSIPPVQKGYYLLGLSGGADSVALLMILLPDIREGRIRLEAVHVNHGIRGTESDEDELFCAGLCSRVGIPFRACRADLAGKTDEASAREARFSFFRELTEQCGTDALMLAHNADDQAETFLMRLLRGAGPEGLSCMNAEDNRGGIRILRPILNLRRQEIRDALRNDGIRWREDSTNNDTFYLRNRIRMELIPVLEKFSSSAVKKISAAAGMISEEHQLLDRQARELLERYGKERMLDAEALACEAAPLQKRVIRLWWKRNAPELREHTLNAQQTETLAGLLYSTKGKINLPGGLYAVRAGRYICLKGDPDIQPETVPVSGSVIKYGSFTLTVGPSEGTPGDGKITQEVPEQLLEGCVIRTRLPGDRIRPFGSAGSKKLQDYLTDRKIPEPFRDQIPLLCKGKEVLMACGVGTGNVPRRESCESTVRLIWDGKMPWTE